MMPDFPEVLVLRHGETEWNRLDRLQGALDSPLTADGRAQAATQGKILQLMGRNRYDWVCSPQGRAATTAKIASADLDVPILTDDRLAEITLGDWTGKLRTEIQAEAPQLFDDSDDMIWYDHAPGGEGLDGLERRVRDFLSDLAAPAVIVTHGITSRVMRCVLMGLPTSLFHIQPGGQGVVYRVRNGEQQQLSLGA